jgi:hypothetical protein
MLAIDQELTQQSARFHEIAGAAQANVAMLDREVARLRAELASALDRSYWLDRLDLDLNALMNRPAARRLRRIWRLTAAAVYCRRASARQPNPRRH